MDPDNRIARMLHLTPPHHWGYDQVERKKKRVGITTNGRAQSRKKKQMRKRMRR